MKMCSCQKSTLLLLESLICSPSTTALLIQSKGDSSWGTSWARDVATSRVFSVSTVFKDGWNDVSISGNDDTDCLITMGHGQGIWVPVLLESPQLCTGGSLVLNSGINHITVVTGTSGHQALLQVVSDIASDPVPTELWSLGYNNIPVSLEAGEEMDVFVGLHPTNGQVYTRNSTTQDPKNLLGLLDYVQGITVPDKITSESTMQSFVPQIVSMDAISGQLRFITDLTVDKAAALAKVAYSSSFDWLLAAGSVMGSGDAFGEDAASENDWDGYLTFIDPITGSLLIQDHPPIRIASQPGKNDYVYDLCVLDDQAFVVGKTEGRLENDQGGSEGGGAFVIKINLQNGQIAWTKQISGASVEAKMCLATTNGLYVGGHTKRTLSQDVKNAGEETPDQNVFMAKFDLDAGDVFWMQNLDSSFYVGDQREDQLFAMEANIRGDVNVMFNSINLEKGLCLIIIMDVKAQKGENELVAFNGTLVENGSGGTLPDINDDEDTPMSRSSDNDNITTIVVAVVVPVVLAISVLAYYLSTRNKRSGEGGVEQAPAVGGDSLPQSSVV